MLRSSLVKMVKSAAKCWQVKHTSHTGANRLVQQCRNKLTPSKKKVTITLHYKHFYQCCVKRFASMHSLLCIPIMGFLVQLLWLYP